MARIIDDHNWRGFLSGQSTDILRGRYPGALPRVTRFGELECAAVYADYAPIIPESEWLDRIKAMTEAKAWPQDLWDRQSPKIKNQKRRPYCWTWSLSQIVEKMRAAMNLPYVETAPVTAGGAVNWRNVGNSLDSTIRHYAKYGIASAAFVPDQWSLSPSTFKPGWQGDALNYRITEWWDVGGVNVWKEAVSILLSGHPVYVGLSWWGHAVSYSKLVVVDGEVCPYTPNTNGEGRDVILKGSRKYPDLGCFGPRVPTFSGAEA
jgi:hypothetical protein